MSGRTKRVLVVDDDELLREFYCRVLMGQGLESVCAANGDQAMRLLESATEDFDLVILDLLMPVRTGWELIEYMKNDPVWDKVPILAITGLAASFDEFERVKDVCDEVLLKGDFELAKFNNTIERLISQGGRAK